MISREKVEVFAWGFFFGALASALFMSMAVPFSCRLVVGS